MFPYIQNILIGFKSGLYYFFQFLTLYSILYNKPTSEKIIYVLIAILYQPNKDKNILRIYNLLSEITNQNKIILTQLNNLQVTTEEDDYEYEDKTTDCFKNKDAKLDDCVHVWKKRVTGYDDYWYFCDICGREAEN